MSNNRAKMSKVTFKSILFRVLQSGRFRTFGRSSKTINFNIFVWRWKKNETLEFRKYLEFIEIRWSKHRGLCNFSRPIFVESHFISAIFIFQKLSEILNSVNDIKQLSCRFFLCFFYCLQTFWMESLKVVWQRRFHPHVFVFQGIFKSKSKHI